MSAYNNAARTAEHSAIVGAALRYCRLGWTVIPLRPATKKPLVCWQEFRSLQPSVSQIEAWWGQWPEANIGILPGSGLAILDVDNPTELQGKAIPPTPTVRTARGWHFYLEIPQRIYSSREIAGVGEILINNYAVAPPSRHETGAAYTWADYLSPWEIAPALAPDWLLEQLRPVTRRVATADGDFWARTDEIVTCPRPCIERLEAEGVPVGQRHDATMRVALDWRRRLCRELSEADLRNTVEEESLKFYAPLREPGQRDWAGEVMQIVADASIYPGYPHSCSDLLLKDRCVGKRNCPFYRAIAEQAQQVADLSIVPSELPGAERKIAEAIIKLYARYNREVGGWLVTSHGDIAEVAGLSRPWVNKKLRCLEVGGLVHIADKTKFRELISTGELTIKAPYGTLLRWSRP